jgi:hypothetical protein
LGAVPSPLQIKLLQLCKYLISHCPIHSLYVIRTCLYTFLEQISKWRKVNKPKHMSCVILRSLFMIYVKVNITDYL